MLPLALALLVPAPQEIDFEKAWEQASQAIERRYYARASRSDELKRRLAETAPKAKAAKSKEEFSRVVNTMIDGFGDSHFDFFTQEDQSYYAMDGLLGGKQELAQIGAWFRPTGDGYTVHMVMNGSPAEKAGLVKGDVIVTVDGAPLRPVSSFKDKQKVELRWRRGSKEYGASIDTRKSSAVEMFLEGSRQSAKVIERNGKKIGYFRLWTMVSDDFRNALSGAVYGRLKDTDAFILDLRDGFGGRPEGFLDPFFRPEATLEWKTGPGQAMKQLFGYGRPLVALINEGSRSAKEVTAYLLKKSKRATLVGRNTAGHVLGTSPMRLNDWSVLEIPMVEVLADGNRLEGKGVAPDVALEREFDAEGKDLFLERAIEVAASKG